MSLRDKLNKLKNTPCQICEVERRLKKLDKKVDTNKQISDNKEKILEDKVTALENKTDKFISEILYERQGNNIILKYIYSDNSEKSITLEDKDTVGVVYDDTEIKTKLNQLENAISDLNSFKQSVAELLDGNLGNW